MLARKVLGTGSALRHEPTVSSNINTKTMPPLDFAKPFAESALARLLNHNVVVIDIEQGKFMATTRFVDMGPVLIKAER